MYASSIVPLYFTLDNNSCFSLQVADHLPVLTFEDQLSRDSKQHGGMNPSFVFLQLYHSNLLHDKSIPPNQRPLLLPSTNQVSRTNK